MRRRIGPNTGREVHKLLCAAAVRCNPGWPRLRSMVGEEKRRSRRHPNGNGAAPQPIAIVHIMFIAAGF
jgi:hypothetical protein